MKKILIVFGTRPEFIKMVPIIKLLQSNKNIISKTCNTGQHKEMVNGLLDFFKVKPDYDLNIMQENQTLDEISMKIFEKFGAVLDEFTPDIVLVQGDTSTAFLCALISFNRKIKIGHIEAGLRTHNKYSPFPEEINRTLISRIADYHFCPTENGVNNLHNEGIHSNIFNVGNTVIDALYMTLEKVNISEEVYIRKYKLYDNEKIILVTGHRRENFGAPIKNICNALIEISKEANVRIIYPVHMNPKVKVPVYEILSKYSNIQLVEPVEYPELVWLLQKTYMVITDSGGMQEEAPALGKPVLVTRQVTERTEVIESGNAILVGWNTDKIINYAKKILYDNDFYLRMSKAINPYGVGDSAKKIISILENEKI